MGIGTSIFLIAVGAVLRYAVSVSAHGFNIHTIGVILIVVGIVGLVLSVLFMTVWSRRRDRVVVDDRYPAPDRYRDPYRSPSP
jgi:beta-lactamase regulating signal transducer with metallopeptidase domain